MNRTEMNRDYKQVLKTFGFKGYSNKSLEHCRLLIDLIPLSRDSLKRLKNCERDCGDGTYLTNFLIPENLSVNAHEMVVNKIKTILDLNCNSQGVLKKYGVIDQELCLDKMVVMTDCPYKEFYE